MEKAKIKPGLWWYGLAVLVMGAGAAGFVLFMFSRLAHLTVDFPQIAVPGERELTLSEPGNYTVFHEYRSVIGNQIYSMDQGGLSGLRCGLVSKESGEEIPLSRAASNSTYSIGTRSGFSVFTFHIDSPGAYVFSGRYPAGKEGPEGVLAVGYAFGKKLRITIFGAFAILLAALVVATVIVVKIYMKRRQAGG